MPQRQTAPASLIEKIDVDVLKKVFKAQNARTEQNRTEQNRTEQNRTEQNLNSYRLLSAFSVFLARLEKSYFTS
jgi:hypothetical protein